MLTKCCPMIFLWKIDVFCTVNHWKRSKTRKNSSCWNLDIWMKITFWPKNVNWSSFWVKKWFSSRCPNFNTSYVCEFLTFANGLRCKRYLFFMKISLGNIWSTSRQHLLPKCCLKHRYKSPLLRLFWRNSVFKATFRQQMLPNCWPNVDFWIFWKK